MTIIQQNKICNAHVYTPKNLSQFQSLDLTFDSSEGYVK